MSRRERSENALTASFLAARTLGLRQSAASCSYRRRLLLRRGNGSWRTCRCVCCVAFRVYLADHPDHLREIETTHTREILHPGGFVEFRCSMDITHLFTSPAAREEAERHGDCVYP